MLIRPISGRSIGALPRYPSPHHVSFVPSRNTTGAGAVSRLAWPSVTGRSPYATFVSGGEPFGLAERKGLGESHDQPRRNLPLDPPFVC